VKNALAGAPILVTLALAIIWSDPFVARTVAFWPTVTDTVADFLMTLIGAVPKNSLRSVSAPPPIPPATPPVAASSCTSASGSVIVFSV